MKKLVQIGISLLIVLIGVGIAASMFMMRPTAARSAKGPESPLVEVLQVATTNAKARIEATGVVVPAREVNIVPQVSGRIVEQSPELRPGGRFKTGEILARIDARDYRLAMRDEESRVRQAELDLQMEEGRQSIAIREWELLGNGRPADESPLALRKPQLATSEQKLNAARGGLERSRLNLERTRLRSPFNAMVLEERIDIGQVVGPTSTVARLVGTDQFWVKASVPMERLSLVTIPGIHGDTGSKARVIQELSSGERIEAEGYVLSLGGELDPQTRTAELMIVIENPLEQTRGKLPLLPGAFVRIEIEGRSIESALAIPRTAVFDGNRVWVVDEAGSLASRTVAIGWREAEDFYITHGLTTGDQVVITPISLPVEGMPVRVYEGGGSGPDRGRPAPEQPDPEQPSASSTNI